jgi:hypothetical protein
LVLHPKKGKVLYEIKKKLKKEIKEDEAQERTQDDL